MPQKGSYLTKEGRAKLEAELEHLRSVKRVGVADRIQKAKELGGTVDNAEYDDSKNEHAFVEGAHPHSGEDHRRRHTHWR